MNFLRFFTGGKPRTRRFDAAAGGRRASSFGTFGPIAPEVAAAAPQVRARARYLAANNPYLSQAVANWTGALVGAGIVPTPTHPKTGPRKLLTRVFNRWADQADIEGRSDFWGLQTLVARALVVDGESFVQMVETPAGPRLRVIPAEFVDEAKAANLENGRFIASGIEFDSLGRRLAYWVLPYAPTDIFATRAPSVRIPADEILHIFRPLAPGQIRGISWLAPVIVPASELDQLTDALLVGAKVAAMHAGFLVDQNGTGAAPYEGHTIEGALEGGIEPGALKVLPSGWDVRFNSPGQAKDVAPFLRHNLLTLAAGLGLPEHLLSGDLTGANYSSLRAGLLPFRQRVEQIQYGQLVPQFLKPVWERVVTSSILSGRMSAPGFERNPEDWLGCDWLPPRPLQVDPIKDVQATALELELGLTTRRKAAAERGWDLQDLDTEIAADKFRKEASHG